MEKNKMGEIIAMLNWMAKGADDYENKMNSRNFAYGMRVYTVNTTEEMLPQRIGNMIYFLDSRIRENKKGEAIAMTSFSIIANLGSTLKLDKNDMALLGCWYGQIVALRALSYITKEV